MRVLRKPELEHRTGWSGMQIWREEKAGRFPKRIVLGPNSVGWIEEEVDDWIRARMAARNGTAAKDDDISTANDDGTAADSDRDLGASIATPVAGDGNNREGEES